jgi:GNAT superfamily N-acetyltransferase
MGGVADAARRFRDVAVDLGWRQAVRVAPGWLVHRRYHAMAADLRAREPDLTRPDELRVSLLTGADVPALVAMDPAMTPREVARRVGEGQRCLLGWWGGELAHYRWESPRPTCLAYLGRVLRPLPGDEIVVGIYTAPRHRGRGIANAVMMDGIARARAAGTSRIVWLTAWWNARSLGLADQAGAEVLGTVGYWALGLHRRYFATGRVRLERDGAVVIERP